MSYANLRSNSRYLKEIKKGTNQELRDDEIAASEAYADVYIEGKLGKSWDSPYPTLIVRIADMIASSMAWQYLHSGKAPKQSNYAATLQNQADKLIDQIITRQMGIKLADGTWDDDYKGAANVEKSQTDGLEVIL